MKKEINTEISAADFADEKLFIHRLHGFTQIEKRVAANKDSLRRFETNTFLGRATTLYWHLIPFIPAHWRQDATSSHSGDMSRPADLR